MRQGYHASPVAYKRTIGNPRVLGLRRAKVRQASAGVEVCSECGSDLIDRDGSIVRCSNCKTEHLLAESEAPRRGATQGSVTHHCHVCGDAIRNGDFYAKRKFYARNSDKLVTVWHCERHARHEMSTSRAFRIEQRCERRSRPHGQRRAAQRSLAYGAKAKDRRPYHASHHQRVEKARRTGWAKVDGVWKKVI